MFGIGIGELFVIFIIAVVVIGPQRLPEVARTIAKLFATAKHTTSQLRDQMHQEVRKFQEMDEIKEFKTVMESELYNMQDKAQSYIQKEVEQEGKRLEDEARGIEHAIADAVDPSTGPAAEPSAAAHAETAAAQPSVAAESAAAPAEDGRSAPDAPEHGGNAAAGVGPDSSAAAGGNGHAPSQAQGERTPSAQASDKPVI